MDSSPYIQTDKPIYYLTKEYETKPDVDKLYDIFVIIYKVKLDEWEKVADEEENDKKAIRYIFFTNLEKAFKRFRLFLFNTAMFKRCLTDSEQLYNLAKQNDDKKVEDIEGDTELPREEQDDNKTIEV